MECGFVGGPGEAVPGAGREAIVAAVDAVADEGAEILGNLAFVLNGEIGNAAAGVEFLRGDDSIGGTGIDAGGAGSAAWCGRPVWWECQGGDDLRKEEPGA